MSRLGAGDVRTIPPTNNIYTALAAAAFVVQLVGLIAIFIVGIILLATLALLTPFLQNLMGYPVLTAGLVLAPRGIGTMVAMINAREETHIWRKVLSLLFGSSGSMSMPARA